MKKCTIYVFLLVIMIGFLFFYAGSCSKGYEYYVKFKANGEEVIFGLGFTDVEENAFANVIYESETLFVATPEAVDKSTPPNASIMILIGGAGPGTYEYGSDSQLTIYYVDSGFMYSLLTGSVTVTSFGEVGGAIEGTFEATANKIVLSGIKLQPPEPDVTITEGSFRVKRIADETYNPFIIAD
jgi:hypothetical protein